MEEWIKVIRKTDGLELTIPRLAYSDKYFDLVDSNKPKLPKTDTMPGEEPEVPEGEMVEILAEDFEEDEDFIDEDEDIAADMKDDFEVEEDVAEEDDGATYTLEDLKAMPYEELKALAKKFDPTLKGNASRAKCREAILRSN